MHELSIATTLLDLVRQHTPEGAAVSRVHVRAGALRAIEPEAMQLAWSAATSETDLASSSLDLELLPWRLTCPDCGREWEADDPFEPCTCGCGHCQPSGSNELLLMSIDVRD